ncbi:DUF1279 superfamily [Polyrhizophydium stewartii]|uniref:DUF1279 superfamily n=1 Tax=Polyrhizophydium stewartii TaxID=2732419 RepID=A0ABR4NE52_9FUNG
MPVTAVPRTLVRMPARTYAGAAGSPGARGGINGLLREYGAVALGVYFSMSFLVFCCCFASITFLGINETHIARVFAQLKRLVGLGTKPDGEAPVSAGGRDSAEEASSAASSSAEREQAERKSVLDWLPEWARNPTVVRIGTNALLAMAMTKLFVPIKVAITAAIVPSVAKRLRAMGFNIGTSGVAGAVREARDRIKNS